MMKWIFVLLFSVTFFVNSYSTQIFVATNGDDGNPGTIGQPLKNISAAVSLAQAGDTIFVRGGIYSLSTTISISKSGSRSKYILSSCISG